MSNRILSYKGLMADGAIDTILLSTQKGEVGYRIIKFELLPYNPGAQDSINVVKIYADEQTSVTDTIDFSDTTLLAAGTVHNVITFDQTIVNQDIYITNKDYATAESINYLLELEVIKLNEMEATVATLKDIRNNQ
jgi:hypothetical protein